MKNEETLGRPMGIWIRVSTEDQAKGDSPEHHEHRARCYAEAKGWAVAAVYRLDGVSGALVANHPETRRMMKDVESGRIKGLIFSKLARLARSTKHLLELSDYFREHEADLVSLQESIDTSTPAGRLFYTLIAAMAQWEREEIADRVKASVPVRAKLGKPLGGKAPFGYQWVDKRLVPNPDEAPIRRKIYELFREHRRKKTVARIMNEAGYRTRGDGTFYGMTIQRMLEDPTPKGWHRANYTRMNSDGTWEYKPEEEWVYHEVEPIVPAELWDECKAILDAQRKTRKKPAKRTAHLFAGLMYCNCGKRMYVPSRSRKYVCPSCRNKMPIDDIDHIFIEQIKGFMLSPDDVAQYLEEANATLADREATVVRLEAQLEAVGRRLNELFDLYHAGEIPADGFRTRYQPLHNEQKQLERQIAEAEAACDILKVDTLSSDHILLEGQNLADRWPKLNRNEKRQIVESLVEEIIVDEEEVTVNLHYFPFSEDVTKREPINAGSSPAVRIAPLPHLAPGR